MQSARAKWFWILLFPLSLLWALVVSTRRKFFNALAVYQSNLKVISVGNIHSGGSGKTPLVKSIAHKFEQSGVVILSRGYRGKLSRTGALVEVERPEGAKLFGDEPWMLANQLNVPIFIDRNRVRAIKVIEKKFPGNLVILDDGFQYLSLRKKVNLVCINPDKKVVDSFCLPLGELREPISSLSDADAIILTPGTDARELELWVDLLKTHFPNLPLYEAQPMVEGFFQGNKSVKIDSNIDAVSFCGISSPDRFLSTIKQIVPHVRHISSFEDHYEYTEEDIDKIIRISGDKDNLVFITTDKDWYKIAGLFKLKNKTLVSVRMGYKMPIDFWGWLGQKLGEKAQ